MGGRLNFLGGKSMKIDNYIKEEIITGKDNQPFSFSEGKRKAPGFKEKEGSAYQQTKRFAFGKSHFS